MSVQLPAYSLSILFSDVVENICADDDIVAVAEIQRAQIVVQKAYVVLAAIMVGRRTERFCRDIDRGDPVKPTRYQLRKDADAAADLEHALGCAAPLQHAFENTFVFIALVRAGAIIPRIRALEIETLEFEPPVSGSKHVIDLVHEAPYQSPRRHLKGQRFSDQSERVGHLQSASEKNAVRQLAVSVGQVPLWEIC